ncbi:hypothetical protein BGW36DRAFT_421425 [Talaromyces proteolyticus]|uniref:Aminoglycoside phosphotransferase domain-containing protein n=1 Tax=Talaromyces proteolyticus TaxID=1131652 RepID=A0AAD4L0J0_9EURO|nr:uncharacterized protein BGW36DRAFT_421425 [Talaromyces proteolyticus]KAH8704834.1 hypothetical protein BGW36DRAFT_421425 [Talaromyces proteolyticus]
MSEDHTPESEFDRFVETIRLDELCATASRSRNGISCSLGNHTIGGFNVVYELNFSDGIVWVARIPLPYNCYQPEEMSVSYAATLKYIKKNSTMPVPKVYAYDVQSAPENKVKATYILMERLSGHALPTLERTDFEPSEEELRLVTKIHTQLTDIILQLASLKFDKIGSLRENPDGEFFVAPYTETNATAYPQYKAIAYNKLSPQHKGPFSSVLEWYNAIAELNRKYALGDPDEEEDRDETVADYELLAELAEHFVVPEFANGPFVINHNDLTIQNILVDDDLNITGILDFPGTIVPLPSLCVYPWLFSDNISGLVTDRSIFLDIFISRDCQSSFPSSALLSTQVRKDLMTTAEARQSFELGLMGPYTSLVLPRLYKEINKQPFDSEREYQRVVDTRGWFRDLVLTGEDGLYSWQRAE